MKYEKTQALDKILQLKKRLKIIQGGSSAGKTIAILLILIDIAQTLKGKTISVVSESFPHLRRGAIRDFLDIMEGHGYYNDDLWSKTDFTYRFETGSKIEFFSADSADKVRGPRRDILFINEANNISFETYTQLAIRTNEDIYIDYNPVQEFWVQTEILNKLENDFIILTYKDNEFLSQNIVKEIESRRDRKDWFTVFGLGEDGVLEGKIYKNWIPIDEVPADARLEVYGLDYGYTNDPSAAVGIYKWNNGYVVDELFYQKGMSNKQIADVFKNQPDAPVIPDSAEPKSNDELIAYGLMVIPAEKGADSVRNGIQVVQGQTIYVTKRSINIIKENRNYLWEVDKQGKVLQVPEHAFSHSMDAIRYGLSYLLKKPPQVKLNFSTELHTRTENSNK